MRQGALLDHDQAAFEKRPEGDHAEFEIQLPGLNFGQIQDVVDQAEQILATAQDIVEILGLFGIQCTEHLFQEYLGKANDRVERRAEFVGHIGQELRLVAVGDLELEIHLLERFLLPLQGFGTFLDLFFQPDIQLFNLLVGQRIGDRRRHLIGDGGE